MSLSVNFNPSALSIARRFDTDSLSLARRLQRIASDQAQLAAEKPASVGISQRLIAQIRGTLQAESDLQLGVSVAQSADSALGQVADTLQRIRQLGVQASNATLSADDQAAINTELTQLVDEIQDTISGASFNGSNPLTANQAITIQAGPDAGQTLTVPAQGPEVQAAANQISLAIGNLAADPSTATQLISAADDALATISTAQSTLGATVNRFESAMRTLAEGSITAGVAQSGLSQDVATDAVGAARQSILQRGRIALLAQANLQPQLLLKLLG
ncbi:MAG: hypothetical protein EXR58_04205 [Chloroflexi bacterium]|nr:hypothetical protein [Chloroflexota bacterium]